MKLNYLNANERIQHRTGDFPLAFYHVDHRFPRYSMAPHWHTETEIIRILHGTLNLNLDENALKLQSGDIITITGGVIHSAEPEDCEYECIVFDLEQLSPVGDTYRQALTVFQSSSVFCPAPLLKEKPGAQECTQRLFKLASADFRGCELEMLCRLMEFLGSQSHLIPETELIRTNYRTTQAIDRIKPALEYIEEHYNEDITLEMLAKLSGFSSRYFCRYFHVFVHKSPIEYLNYYRIERACAILCDPERAASIADLAVQFNFFDSSAFIKQFRKYKNTTPNQYRSQFLSRLPEQALHPQP